MKQVLVWLFGRGASLACKFPYSVGEEIKSMPRADQVQAIMKEIRQERQRTPVDITPYMKLLTSLRSRTQDGWCHLFVTTNWDNLLEEAIDELHLIERPKWLANSHVFHINGTSEIPTSDFRSPMLLENDSWIERKNSSVEESKIFARMMCERNFLVIGMSFQCDVDRFFLSALGYHSFFPDSRWIVLNRSEHTLEGVCNHIQSAFPKTLVIKVKNDFELWIDEGMPELESIGILSFNDLDEIAT